MQLNDYLCPKCEHLEMDVLCKRTERRLCPKCGEEMHIKVNAPPYHMSIEDFVRHKRGHLDFKVKKSLEKEQSLQDAKRRAIGIKGQQHAATGIKVEKGGVSGGSFKFGGRKA